MNTEYTRIENKVVVRNEEGQNRVVPNQDNIEEILITENTIEEMENKKKEVQEQIKKFMEKCNMPSSSSFFHNILPFLIGVVAPLSVVPICKYLGTPEDTLSVIDRVKNVVMCFTTIPSTALSLEKLLENKYKEHEERALNTQLQMLNKRINDENKRLETLQNNNINTITNCFETKLINNDEIRENVETYCDLYYECSFDLEGYYDYYLRNGKLPKRIERKYDQTSQDMFKEYIEEKGPVLIKTRKY